MISISDLLVHVSNVLLLISYSVREILWLRWFAVAAAVIVIPYYLLQPTVLWPPVFWGSVFTAINLFQIARIYWERRSVTFSEEEKRLYELCFSSLRPRDFYSFVMAGEWKDARAGEYLVQRDQTVEEISIAIDGTVDVSREGQNVGTLNAGETIGLALALTKNPSPVDMTFRDDGRYIRWQLATIRRFLDAKPELRAVLQNHANKQLAERIGKLVK